MDSHATGARLPEVQTKMSHIAAGNSDMSFLSRGYIDRLGRELREVLSILLGGGPYLVTN